MITHRKDVQRSDKAAISKSLAWGAGIALLLISLFLAGVRNPSPNWPSWWIVRPVIVVTVAGATGGFLFFLTGAWRRAGGRKAIVGYTAGVLLYTLALWLGSVLGLDGTLWH